MIIKEYNPDGSVKSEFDGTQYEYDRYRKEQEKGETTTVNRPKVIIQENVEKVTKYDVKNIKFEKSDLKEIFKNNPEKLQDILKERIEDGDLDLGTYDLPFQEVKDMFKNNPEKLQDIILDDLERYGRIHTDLSDKDVREIFRNNPEKLQDMYNKLADIEQTKADTRRIEAEKKKAIIKGVAVGTSIAISAVGIAGAVTILVKNDIVPPPNAWLKPKTKN